MCYTGYGMNLQWMFFARLKLYQMGVAYAILFVKKIDISMVTADYLFVKSE